MNGQTNGPTPEGSGLRGAPDGCGPQGGPCPNWTFNTSTNRISTSGFTYDSAGNLTADGTHSYQWDGEGRLVTVDNGATIVLVYNALGQQVGVTKGGTDVVWHLKSPADKSEGDYSIAYVGWNPAGVFFLGEKRVGFDVNGGMVFLHQNHLNSVTVPTTFDGSLFDDILYYPWGQYWAGEGFVFAGMDHYWEDVLHNTPNRQYAFYEGRWLSPDPLAGDVTDPQSLNRYAYVLGNPTTLTDPLGLHELPKKGEEGGGEPCDPFAGVGCPEGGGGGIDPCNDPWYADSHAECGSPGGGPFPPPGGGGGGGGNPGPGNAQKGPPSTTIPWPPIDPTTPITIEVILGTVWQGITWCVGNPWCVGAVAVGTVAAGAYTGYKIYQAQKADLREFREAVRQIEKRCGTGLDEADQRRLHDAISKQRYTLPEIVEIGVGMFCPGK
ncbi:MAG: hypothetical protein LAO04_18260 [Acidobacteriia bacterium]|nr:hypothetical protein [Terriglobia bacterium]